MAVRWWKCWQVAVVGALSSGCAQTAKVDDSVSTSTLVQKHKSVALMRVGAASPNCLHVGVLLGTRNGDYFMRGQVIKVANVRSIQDPAVAEVELEPGEHHVIGYACQSDRDTKTVMDKADAQTYRTSYANFTVKPGEVVNVGYLHFGASHVGRSAFGRPLRLDVSVTDWPLKEIDHFKARRPGLYAQMTTRLMTVTNQGPHAPSPDECSHMKTLHAEGKLQKLPAQCAAPVPATAAAKKPRST